MTNKPFDNWDSGKSPGVSDHGALEGLGDDDHEQYLNTTRHDTTDRHAIGDTEYASSLPAHITRVFIRRMA